MQALILSIRKTPFEQRATLLAEKMAKADGLPPTKDAVNRYWLQAKSAVAAVDSMNKKELKEFLKKGD